MSPGPTALTQANTFLAVNRPQDALRVLYASLASYPDDAAALRLVAQAHLRVDSTAASAQQAVVAVNQSLGLEPDNAFAWRILSVAFSRIDRHADARDAARRAQSLEPFGWPGHTSVAHADASAKTVTKETPAAVAEAIRIAPNEPEVYYAAARVAMAGGKARAAASHYRTTLALNPDHANARNNLALIHLRGGNAGRAAAAFVGLLAQNPNSDLALRNLRATAQRTLRLVNLVLWAGVIVANGLLDRQEFDMTQSQRTTCAAIVAVAATVLIVGYVLWIRRKAGAYFGRFIRSIPHTDKVLTAWSIVLALGLLAIDCAVFTPDSVTRTIYLVEEAVLIVSLVAVLVVSAYRRATKPR